MFQLRKCIRIPRLYLYEVFYKSRKSLEKPLGLVDNGNPRRPLVVELSVESLHKKVTELTVAFLGNSSLR